MRCCPNCGKPIENVKTFCPYCGHKILAFQNAGAGKARPASKPKTGCTKKWAIGILLVLFLLTAVSLLGLRVRTDPIEPVLLDTVPPLGTGWEWNAGCMLSPLLNDYTEAANAIMFTWEMNMKYDGSVLFTGVDVSGGYSSTAAYRVNGAYSGLTMNISPGAFMSANAVANVAVYADKELAYISPEFTRDAEQICCTVDIADAKIVNIKVSCSDYTGTVILSDVLLWESMPASS